MSLQIKGFLISMFNNQDFFVISAIVVALLIFYIFIIFAGKKVERINVLKIGGVPFVDLVGKVVEIRLVSAGHVCLYWNNNKEQLVLSNYSKKTIGDYGCSWIFDLELINPFNNKVTKYKSLEYDITFLKGNYKEYIDNILKLGDSLSIRLSLENKRDYFMMDINQKWNNIRKSELEKGSDEDQ